MANRQVIVSNASDNPWRKLRSFRLWALRTEMANRQVIVSKVSDNLGFSFN